MKRILLVEDDKFIQEIYQVQFQSIGYEVEIAGDGEEGFAKIKSSNYDCVLLDIMMPKMDGVSMLQQVREWEKQEGRQSLAIVVLTNFGEESTSQKCIDLGVSGFIIKSRLSPEEVVEQVEQIISSQKKLD